MTNTQQPPEPETLNTPDDLDHQLQVMRGEIEAHEVRAREQAEMIRDLDTARAIDAALIEANVIDLEAARLLTELELADADEPDVNAAINEMQRRRPYLFAQINPSPRSSGAQAPAHEPPVRNETQRTADEAAVTGRREDLLRYLRLRRRRPGP